MSSTWRWKSRFGCSLYVTQVINYSLRNFYLGYLLCGCVIHPRRPSIVLHSQLCLLLMAHGTNIDIQILLYHMTRSYSNMRLESPRSRTGWAQFSAVSGGQGFRSESILVTSLWLIAHQHIPPWVCDIHEDECNRLFKEDFYMWGDGMSLPTPIS